MPKIDPVFPSAMQTTECSKDADAFDLNSKEQSKAMILKKVKEAKIRQQQALSTENSSIGDLKFSSVVTDKTEKCGGMYDSQRLKTTTDMKLDAKTPADQPGILSVQL